MKPTQWRDAIRDSDELDRTAKLVAFVLSTYMNGSGKAFPSKGTIAAGAGLGSGRRAVDQAIVRLEAAGYLDVQRTKGRTSWRYTATTNGATSHALRRSTSHESHSTSHESTANGARRATESGSKAKESAFQADLERDKEEELLAPEEVRALLREVNLLRDIPE